MKEFRFDYKQSKGLFDKYKNRIEQKMCYLNIFHMVLSEREKFLSGEWKVAYGAMPSVVNTMVRHCFIVTEDGRAIDPTVYSVPERENTDEAVYIAHTIFNSIQEYLGAIDKNKCRPDLLDLLRKKDVAMYKELEQRGLIMLGW